ncbi:MAG: GAF domain-containing protein, partial [Aeromonadaceae bacterium]|nr:GAF domain-containing protein [Aeromonadaceae bacterium]
MSTTSHLPSREQLLGIIQLQTDIAQLGLDLSGTMDLVVDRALSLVEADGVVIALVEDEFMVYRAASGCSSGLLGVRLALNASLSGLCVRTGKPLFCDDSEVDPDVDRDACRRQGIRSLLVIPLKFGDLIVGVIKLVRRQPKPFD